MFKLIKQILFVFQFLLVTTIAFAQDRTIGGKVTSPQGEGIPGVTVSVKGTTIGTITDIDGVYKLTVSADVKKLTYSFVGFRIQEIEIGSQSTIDVKLVEENKQLDEVVVTGLASSIKRSNLANSVASISADQLLGTTKPATLDNALSGKIIGANIVQNSGAPGGGISIKMRGISSINGSSEPLYIIDGIIVNNSQFGNGAGGRAFSGASSASNATSQDQTTNRMSDINPADIENIEILKGPSAAAIYGTRANAGVIVITTKRGKAGKTKVSFRQDFGAVSAINLLGSEGWTNEKIDQYGGVYGLGVADAKAALAAAGGKTYDWEKVIYGNTGIISNTGISVSGGTDKTQFMISAGLNDETGIQKNTGFGRRSLKANIDHKLAKFINIKSNSTYMNSVNQRGFAGNDNNGVAIGYSLAYIPNFINLSPNDKGVYPASNAGTNPLQVVDKAINNESTNRFMQSITSDIYFFQNERSSLKLALTGGFDYLLTENEVYMPDDLLAQKALANPGVSRYTKSRNMTAYIQSFLSYNYKIWRLDLTSQVGMIRLITDRDISATQGEGLPAGQRNPELGAVRNISQFFLRSQDVGFVGQQEFNFEDKIVGTLGFRADKSSLNGDNAKLFLFPRASAAINITKFDFWKIEQVSQIKLRAAYGETGGVPNFGNTFTSMASGVIGGKLGLFAPSVNGNAGIQPETASEIEFGLDLGFLDNRIGVEFTYYDKKVFNLINAFTTASSTGVTSISAYPVGDLRNTGIELGINASVVKNTNFTWTTGVNYWFNRSEMTRLIIPDAFVGSGFGTFGRNRLSLGNSPTAWYGTPNIPVKDAAGNTVGTTPTKYGDNQPKFQLSWSNNFKIYKNFDLSFLIHTSQGGYNSSLNYVLKDEGGTTGDWSKPSSEVDGTGAAIPMGQTARSFAGISATASTTANAIQDASYIRLREVALYYTLPKATLNKFFKNAIENVKIGVSGNNLITITDYYGYDPEASNFGNQAVGAGIDLLSFPTSKRMFFHIAVEF
jgi:TonB-linked SusC/RagA family outer membrane protein